MLRNWQIFKKLTNLNLSCVQHFLSRDIVKLFMKGSGLLKCAVCSATFSLTTDLKRHIERVHEGKKLFKCAMDSIPGPFWVCFFEKILKSIQDSISGTIATCIFIIWFDLYLRSFFYHWNIQIQKIHEEKLIHMATGHGHIDVVHFLV